MDLVVTLDRVECRVGPESFAPPAAVGDCDASSGVSVSSGVLLMLPVRRGDPLRSKTDDVLRGIPSVDRRPPSGTAPLGLRLSGGARLRTDKNALPGVRAVGDPG
jgi:hypothetical protein